MSQQLQDHLARGEARIVDAPSASPRHQVEVDRNFEMPAVLYAATVGLYLTFLAVMFAAFATPGLIIPMVIFTFFIAAGFGVPTIWTKLKGNDTLPKTLGQFAQKGIMTNTGHCTARDAMIQMLLLPVLIVLWACAVVVIAVLV